ncbi:MAG: OsmC family protein [Thermodesulfobacteriota bacterium]
MELELRQIGPRKLEVVSPNWSFVVDLKEKFGGENSGPNPSELTAAALAACELLTGVVWASRRHHVELEGLAATVKWDYAEKPDRISRINVEIRNVSSQLGDERKLRAFTAIAKGCTVTETFKMPPELNLKVE